MRLLYSEPEDYLTDEYQNPSIGIEKISSVPGFINKTPLNKPLLLIMLLGYEPARSLAIYNNIDPDRTYLIVPHPPYNEQWKGRTERKNSNLINTVKEDRVERMHSYDVNQFVQEFSNFIANEDIDLNQWNCLISPLSTKPQTLGLFNYWRENKGAFSLIHSTPLKYNKLFKPTGISKRHIIKDANP